MGITEAGAAGNCGRQTDYARTIRARGNISCPTDVIAEEELKDERKRAIVKNKLLCGKG